MSNANDVSIRQTNSVMQPFSSRNLFDTVSWITGFHFFRIWSILKVFMLLTQVQITTLLFWPKEFVSFIFLMSVRKIKKGKSHNLSKITSEIFRRDDANAYWKSKNYVQTILAEFNLGIEFNLSDWSPVRCERRGGNLEVCN